MRFLMQKWVTERRITEERTVDATDVFEATRIASKEWGWPQNEMQFINSVPLPGAQLEALAKHFIRCSECGKATDERLVQNGKGGWMHVGHRVRSVAS